MVHSVVADVDKFIVHAMTLVTTHSITAGRRRDLLSGVEQWTGDVVCYDSDRQLRISTHNTTGPRARPTASRLGHLPVHSAPWQCAHYLAVAARTCPPTPCRKKVPAFNAYNFAKTKLIFQNSLTSGHSTKLATKSYNISHQKLYNIYTTLRKLEWHENAEGYFSTHRSRPTA